MVWIGVYIAVASFICILAMAADLLHGFRHKKFWFPCKYFSLNAASITVIAVTMKLPVDLTAGRCSFVDQGSKLGSLAFMCIMMANLMPSLASMDNKTLLSNVIGLCVLVITVVVDICIQMNTGVFRYIPFNPDQSYLDYFNGYADFITVAYIYTSMVLLLLLIMISSSLTIPASKEILESKYHRATNKVALTDHCLPHIQVSLVEKLRQHVKRYWVIAETGSPQFVMASNPLSAASGVICVCVMVINSLILLLILFKFHELGVYGPASPYKWSTTAIFITQSIGVLVGSIAPILRCFSVFNFKLATKLYKNHIMFFKVEKYWTQKLCEWKQSPMPFLTSSRRSTSLILDSRNIVLSLCIGSQKARRFTPSITSTHDDIDEDIHNYMLQTNNEMELAEKILKRFANSINSFILQAEKKQDNNLLKLLEKSSGFKGVETFDSDHVQSLLSVEPVN
ncbi:hypothetical protein SSX86_029267 [Deinandra increscens subsp. villosa]|uniref:Uncharacterized protein n=1 Tax=Deinandra increscens subsp. villosa TaxID=3103831 RepID=A0AAP0CEG0_9ASTR